MGAAKICQAAGKSNSRNQSGLSKGIVGKSPGSVFADDYMIEEPDLHQSRCIHHAARDLVIGPAGAGVT